jgi:repressor LexA
VHAHLANLEKVGLLRRDPTKPRAIELLVDRAKRVVRGSGLPLIGHVSAGEPILAEENIDEYVQVPSVIGGEQGDYILQVKGDSMRDAGILEGDLLAVHRTQEARSGQIVVARLADEVTVKRYRRRGNMVQLEAENPDFGPIDVDLARDALTIEGVAVGIIRNGKTL